MASQSNQVNDLVIALDIGSTFSGYACQYLDDFKNNKRDIWMNNIWGSTNKTYKTTTCVLITVKDRELVAIGDMAEMQFSKLYDQDKASDYFFFKNFKMVLYNELFHEDGGKIDSAEDYFGKHEPITFVMSKFIEGLKKHCLQGFKEGRNLNIPDANIRWVLTIPAIWNDDAKDAMRKSAVKAGIPDRQLILALEPEAAAVHCLYLSPQEKTGMDGLGDVGDKFMLMDLGGGTVDITAAEVTDDGCLKQIYRANGGPWGGQRINDSFSQLVRDVFQTRDGKSAFATCTHADLLKMEQEFEQQKVNIQEQTPRGEEWVKLALPDHILNEIKDNIKVNPTKYSNYFHQTKTGCLVFKPEVIARELFGETMDLIVGHLQSIFREISIQGIKKLVLVGGFAEAPIVREKIQNALPGCRIYIPSNPFYAVLKGAVLYGHNPDIFRDRICRFTYGIATNKPFISEFHDERRKIVDNDGKVYCSGVFDVHIKRDQVVSLNEEQPSQTYQPWNDNDTSVQFGIYQSVSQNPKYTNDEGCKKLGTLIVELPEKTVRGKREAEVTMIYGGTELFVKGIDKATRKEFKTSIVYDRYAS